MSQHLELTFPDFGLGVDKIKCQWNSVTFTLSRRPTDSRAATAARDKKQQPWTEAVLNVAHTRALFYLWLCTITNQRYNALRRVCTGPCQALSSLHRSHNLACRHRRIRLCAATKYFIEENAIAVNVRLCCVDPTCDSLRTLPSNGDCVIRLRLEKSRENRI